ncbi:WD-40 repeat [Micractinium conductrix]|uniref:WD-40 repeat n=1 Tax=Micractinium conductrix TaxID=554055 RepID=A0A2P6VIM2_9CHLO|nr:WD-40 repeat [Micractinium conductrix]|eukprot:PSC73953.1 WD-40 repeat [Micractinium conductrix]
MVHVETGVIKLGSFELEDKLVLGRLGDDSIATLGSEQGADLDYERTWRTELQRGQAGTRTPDSDRDAGNHTGWSTSIPVTAFLINIQNAAAPDKEGLLQPLLKREQAGGLSYAAFALPAVQAVIDWKWERFCRRLLVGELCVFLVWLASFFAFTILFQDEDTQMSLRQLLATPRGRATVACDVLALLAMAPFVLIEFSTVGAYGLCGWASNVWNINDVVTYVLQIAIAVQHLGRLNISSDWLSIMSAAQCIFLIFRLQYFSRVFRATRFAFLEDIKEVLHDVKYYLAFIVLLVLGFATAFHILYRRDQEEHDEYKNIGRAFIAMCTFLAGNADLNTLYKDAHNPVAASVLGVLFVFVLATVLMNLLISIMTNTLDKVTENEGLRMQLSKTQAIDELEATIPPWVERLFPGLYPRFLHVLRVDPTRLDAVKPDRQWAGSASGVLGEEGGEEGAAAAEPAGPNKEGLAGLEGKVDQLSAELAEVKEMLRQLVKGGQLAVDLAMDPEACTSRQPLLGDVEEATAPPAEEAEADACDVARLLSEQQANVLRYLQTLGVAKEGEFEEQDDIAFSAFEGAQLVAFGSDSRELHNPERRWRAALAAAGPRGQTPRQGGWKSTVAGLSPFSNERRWNTYARRLLVIQGLWFLLWFVPFYAFLIAFQGEELSLSLRELLQSTRGRLAVGAELLALVGMAPFLLLEAGTIPAYGLKAYLDPWNLLDLSTYFFQAGQGGGISITVIHLGRFSWWTKSEWLTAALAAQAVLLVFRLQYFMPTMKSIRYAFLPIVHAVWLDLRYIFYSMLFVMFGFAAAFHVALRRDEDQKYSSLGTSLLAMFEHQFGDIEFKQMEDSKSPKTATALAIAYTFLQGTFIINLVLGIVVNSLDKVMDQAEYRVLLQQARIIDELESTMPRWLQRRHPDWFPAWLHFLRLNPDKLDRVQQDALWSRMGKAEPERLQPASSSPLENGHPRAANGGEGDGGEGNGGGEGGSGGAGGEGKEDAPVEDAAGVSPFASQHEDGQGQVSARLAVMEAQLEEQGRLLRALLAAAGPCPPSPDEQT